MLEKIYHLSGSINSWAWNLNKVKPDWYDKDLPTTTHFENNKFKSKKVGDLKLKDGVKLK